METNMLVFLILLIEMSPVWISLEVGYLCSFRKSQKISKVFQIMVKNYRIKVKDSMVHLFY